MIRKYYYPTRSHKHYFDDFVTKALWDVSNTNSTRNNNPAVNIKEVNEGYEIELVAPGLNKEDFELTLDDNQLTVSIKQAKESENSESPNYIRKEFSLDAFKRTFSLKPNTFDLDNVEARYEGGILTISLHKLPEVEPQKIDIA